MGKTYGNMIDRLDEAGFFFYKMGITFFFLNRPMHGFKLHTCNTLQFAGLGVGAPLPVSRSRADAAMI